MKKQSMNKKENNQVEQVDTIEQLRHEMHKSQTISCSQPSRQTLQISQELDHYIVAYMKSKKDKKKI